MSLMSMFWEALLGDPPETPLSYAELSREAKLISEVKRLRDERDCFKRELLRLGYTEHGLTMRATNYRRTMLQEVRRAS